jgi:outer membrane protein assembly factor BamD
MAEYRDAFSPNLAKARPAGEPSAASDADATTAAPAPPVAAAPPTLEDVPSEGAAAVDDSSKTVTVVEPAASSAEGSSGTGLGVEVLTPGAEGNAPATGTPASGLPAATGAQDPNYGLPMPKKASTALPPVEKAAPAPDQINDVEGHSTPAAQIAPTLANGKKKKVKAPKEDKNDESSSKKKPKKGLDKLNPF